MNIKNAVKMAAQSSLAICFITMLFSQVAQAQELTNDPGFKELGKMYGGINPEFSEDASPVQFTIGGVRYSVPRNYIINMDNWKGGPQSLVAFEVAFPGFKPYSQETRYCFTVAPAYRPKDCLPIRFLVIDNTPVSDDERVANIQKHDRGPKGGPFGFQMYEIGPDNARSETYVKKIASHLLMYSCVIYPNNGRGRNGDCRNESRLPNHNALIYHLYLPDLDKAEQIDDGIRPLIESFTVTGGKQ